MSDERTPITSEVRAAYAVAKFECATDEAKATPNLHDQFDASFDRWLATHDAKVRADQIEKDAAIAGDLARKHGMYLFGGGWSPDAGMTKVARAIRAQLNGENDE